MNGAAEFSNLPVKLSEVFFYITMHDATLYLLRYTIIYIAWYTVWGFCLTGRVEQILKLQAQYKVYHNYCTNKAYSYFVPVAIL